MKGRIYIWTSSNNAIYIGQTRNTAKRRKTEHISILRAGKHWNSRLQRIYNKYGENAIEFDVLEDDIPIECLDEAEMFWIAYYKYIGADVINVLPGGKIDATQRNKTAKQKESVSKAQQKTYEGFISPEGSIYKNITNLKAFALLHNVPYSGLHFVATGKLYSFHKWRAITPPVNVKPKSESNRINGAKGNKNRKKVVTP